LVSAFWGEGRGFAEAVEGGARLVMAALDPCRLAISSRDHDLLPQAHHGLEEVVIGPHLVVELIKSQGLGDGVEALVAQIGSHEAGVLLFDEAVIVPFNKLRTGLWAGRLRER
jgi:hypothetical protein